VSPAGVTMTQEKFEVALSARSAFNEATRSTDTSRTDIAPHRLSCDKNGTASRSQRNYNFRGLADDAAPPPLHGVDP
jgi:hypothetical protein